jgi:endoglucanase
MRRYAFLALFCAAACGSDDPAPADDDATTETIPRLKGVNLAVGEFGHDNIPGVRGTDYDYPNADEVDYFFGKGMNVIRLPFLIERLQVTVNGPVDLSGIDPIVDHITDTGYALLDPHNYARRSGTLYGSAGLPASALADFWGKVADHYKDNPRVVFGLMNEPNGIDGEDWLPVAQAAVDAIRESGAKNLIAVPGVAWTGAWTWPNSSSAMADIDDDNFVYEMHQYFDSDYSGRNPNCVHAAETLEAATAWLAAHGRKALLGEFGGANNAGCRASLDDALAFMDANDDQWLGWTYWAAGPWWGNYMFSIEPDNGVDRPQMEWLAPYLD